MQHRHGRRDGLAGDGLDQDTLITRRRRIIARTGRVDDDFEIELAGNRRCKAVSVIRQAEIDRLARREDVVVAARYRSHTHPKLYNLPLGGSEAVIF